MPMQPVADLPLRGRLLDVYVAMQTNLIPEETTAFCTAYGLDAKAVKEVELIGDDLTRFQMYVQQDGHHVTINGEPVMETVDRPRLPLPDWWQPA